MTSASSTLTPRPIRARASSSVPVAPTIWSETLCGTMMVATEDLASLPKPPESPLVTRITRPVASACDGRWVSPMRTSRTASPERRPGGYFPELSGTPTWAWSTSSGGFLRSRSFWSS